MATTPKETFDFAIKRANHYLTLYNILHNSRQRAARSDWMERLKQLMHWPLNENIVRIDGQNQQSMLLLRESVAIDREHFEHEFTSELLRASIVATISALDRYIHDIINQECLALLRKPESDVPNELKKMKIPLIAVKKSLEKARQNSGTRPGSLLKKEIQDILHRDFTFQNISSIDKASKILGITDFWQKIADEMPGNANRGKIQNKLSEITKRRNQIVHESDIILKTKAKVISQREIKYNISKDYVEWICDFVNAFDLVVSND